MGREIVSDNTAIEITPPTRYVVDTSSDSADIHVEWAIEPIDGGTRLTFHSEGDPKGSFAKLALSLVKGNFEKTIRANLENLKTTLEA